MADRQQAVMEVLHPRLRGDRFEHGTVPLDVLRDLAVLEEMLVEVAKQKWRDANPGRQRIPKGFVDGLEIRLTGVEEGSAIVKLSMYLLTATSYLPGMHPAMEWVEQAREAIVAVIDAAEHGRPIDGHIDVSSLTYFDRLGRSLRDGESMDLAVPSGASASLTRDTRRRLVLAKPGVEEVSEELVLRGRVSEANKVLNSFQLLLSDGRLVTAPMDARSRDTVLEAFNSFGSGSELKVLVKGVGTTDRQGQPRRIQEVAHMAILDPLDVEARLDDLAALRDGWFDGGGVAFSRNQLDWLGRAVLRYLGALDPPRLYATPEGNVLAEWQSEPWDVSVEFELSGQSGQFHAVNLDSGDVREARDDLSSESGWQSLESRLAELTGGGCE